MLRGKVEIGDVSIVEFSKARYRNGAPKCSVATSENPRTDAERKANAAAIDECSQQSFAHDRDQNQPS